MALRIVLIGYPSTGDQHQRHSETGGHVRIRVAPFSKVGVSVYVGDFVGAADAGENADVQVVEIVGANSDWGNQNYECQIRALGFQEYSSGVSFLIYCHPRNQTPQDHKLAQVSDDTLDQGPGNPILA